MSQQEGKKAIISALAFYQIWNQALSRPQLFQRVYGAKMTYGKFEKMLNELVEAKVVIDDAKRYSLHKNDNTDQVTAEVRACQEEIRSRAQLASRLLAYIPFIHQVYIVNSYAIGGCNDRSDIDLCIITKKGYIWLVRFISFAVFHLAGIRRYKENIEGLFCLTFYIERCSQDVEHIALKPEDPYLVYWLQTAIPIWEGRRHIAEHNQWTSKHLPLYIWQEPLYKKSLTSEVAQSFLEQILQMTLIAYVGNRVMKRVFQKRFKRNVKNIPNDHGIVISDNMQKLHDKDYRSIFRKKMLENIMKITPTEASEQP